LLARLHSAGLVMGLNLTCQPSEGLFADQQLRQQTIRFSE